MAFAFSRFDLLTDDAHDPFEKKKKAAKPGGTGNTTQKKGGAKGSGQGQTQGQSAGKKKKKNNTNSNATNNNQPVQKQEEFPMLGTRDPEPKNRPIAASRTNQNDSSQNLPKEKRSKEQWSEWAKRDEEFVADSYETDLEAALVQSKVDFENEQARILKNAAKKSKKKGVVTVPLSDFNNIPTAANADGFGLKDSFGQYSLNGYGDGLGEAAEEARLAQFRHESQLEIQRERQIALERKLIMSRTPILPPPAEKTKELLDPIQLAYGDIIMEKDNLIAQLTNDKLELAKENEALKNRVKKICTVFGDAELKDKATLVNELQKVTKLNQDLNDNIQELHALLEQEKSKSHAALLEVRKLNEQSRRRNPHSESAQ